MKTQLIVVTKKRKAIMPILKKGMGGYSAALHYEQAVFSVASRITKGNYNGGTWHVRELSNGGFFMAYTGDEEFLVYNDGAQSMVKLSGDAFSVCVNMYVSSRLSFEMQQTMETSARAAADNYHNLRHFAYQDDGQFTPQEIGNIASALD